MVSLSWTPSSPLCIQRRSCGWCNKSDPACFPSFSCSKMKHASILQLTQFWVICREWSKETIWYLMPIRADCSNRDVSNAGLVQIFSLICILRENIHPNRYPAFIKRSPKCFELLKKFQLNKLSSPPFKKHSPKKNASLFHNFLLSINICFPLKSLYLFGRSSTWWWGLVFDLAILTPSLPHTQQRYRV